MSDAFQRWVEHGQAALATFRQGQNDHLAPCAVSMLTAVYGPNSPQLEGLKTAMKDGFSQKGFGGGPFYKAAAAAAAIENTISEINAGLAGSLRMAVSGEVLSDLLSLGKERLEDKSESAKNVAAVMVAAAYENLIRRMGKEFAGVVDRPKLENVINSLKDANVLKGGSVGTAQGYLKFRNDTLHADWEKVDRPQIESCVAFIEGLLLKHFS